MLNYMGTRAFKWFLDKFGSECGLGLTRALHAYGVLGVVQTWELAPFSSPHALPDIQHGRIQVVCSSTSEKLQNLQKTDLIHHNVEHACQSPLNIHISKGRKVWGTTICIAAQRQSAMGVSGCNF